MMKNRNKRKALLGLFILLITVTIGYALLSATGFIKGTSRIADGVKWDIHWDDTSVAVTTGSVDGSDPVVSGDKLDVVTFTADVELPGDFYEFTVDAINEGTINGKIKSVSNLVYEEDGETETTLPEYIHYTVTYDDGTTEPDDGDVLVAGQSKKYKIRVEFDEEATTVPSENVTYVYKFSVQYEQTNDSGGDDPQPPTPDPVCVRATTLHTATCTNGSCTSVGYRNGDTITFGKVSTGTFEYGNAYDCKVTKDGDYTERFYYIGSNGNNAALIYYTNFEGDAIGTTGSYYYDTAVTMLPKTEKWDNIDVKFGSNDEYAARFIYPSEMEAACDITITDSGHTGDPDKCQYIMENSRFISTTTGRTGMWLEYTDNKYRRLHTTNRKVETKTATSENYARPVIEVDASLVSNDIDPSELATMTFDVQGGDSVEAKPFLKGYAVGELPTPTKAYNAFAGWYTDTNWTTQVTASSVFNGDVTVYAKWSTNGTAVVNGTTYNTLAAALTAVDTSDKTTITLLKDTTEAITIPNTRNIVLNLGGHILSNSSASTIKNNGTLELRNGTIAGSCTQKATVENTATLNVYDVRIENNLDRQALYNSGGTATIYDGAYLTSIAPERSTLHNLNTGTVTILGGTIVSDNLYAIYNEKGNLTIGVKDGSVDSTKPVIQGNTYGIAANYTYKFYDGIIKGGTDPLGTTSNTGNTPTVTTDTNKTKVSEIENNTDYLTGTEEIDSTTYNTITLEVTTPSYTITFNPNDGEVTPIYKNIDIGDAVGELPVPTKGVYTFDGWYTGLTDGTLVTEETIPDGSVTYYAHWHYEASDQVVNFNMTNDPLDNYYSSIGTWKNDQSTFQTNMDDNFNNYNCSACTGPRYQDCPAPAANKSLCDQPNGYNTGVSDDLNIYLSDENTKEKGSLVTYTTSTNGKIYNMIPGVTYYWESTSDSNIHGLVKALGNRRLITTTVRNVRDLGGLEVDTDNDGTVDGTLKYGRLFRGAKLSSSQTDVTNLEKLGITEELDLRGSSEGAGDARFTNFQPREITNYLINPTTHNANYTVFRQAVEDTMLDVIANENIYFHCKIGTDRTGTMAYFLEGLLGVSEEDRVQDYELSYFYGLLNRHRFHDQLDGSSINPRFTTMHNTFDTNQKIYEWFTYGMNETEKQAADDLINDFRTAMINYN